VDAAVSDPSPQTPGGAPADVLVADPDAGVRSQVRLALTTDGLSVIEADSLAAAARELAARRPRLVVVSDRIDGRRLAASIKAQPETRHASVLLVHGRPGPTEAPDGVDGLLAEPFTSFALVRKARRLLDAT
jgi:CheY-like chemotaxis protein